MPFSSNEEASKWRKCHLKKWNEYQRNRSRNRRQELRQKIIDLLGGKCCNPFNRNHGDFLSDSKCLQIDHVNGGGSGKRTRKHRGTDESYYLNILKEIKAGSKDYQLLCANCNWIKKFENNEVGNLLVN